jgi:hypothetical protein
MRGSAASKPVRGEVMTEAEKTSNNKGEVRPTAGKDSKLEDRIADEKDEELVKESVAKERQRDS